MCSVHKIFEQDPSVWMQYLHKEVCVSTEDGNTHTGRVYTIDPVSETVVLATVTDDQVTKMKLLLGHCVRDITVLDDNVSKYEEVLHNLFKVKQERVYSGEELTQRRDMVKAWMLKNRIPIEITAGDPDVMEISGALHIGPPYLPENCTSTNEIILGRIQGLLKSMPKDLKDDW